MDVNWDLDKLLQRMGIPVQGGVGVNVGVASIGYNLWDFDTNLNFFHIRNFDLDGQPTVSMTFPTAMAWWVGDGSGTVIGTGNSTVASFDVGGTLHVTFPMGRVAPMSGAPTYSLDGSTTSSGSLRFAGNLADKLLSAELTMSSKFKEIVNVPGHWECGVAQVLCDAASSVTSELFDWISTTFFRHTFSGVNLRGGPEEAKVLTSFDETEEYFPETTWSLQGFSSQAGAAFTLDPEDPGISLWMGLANGLLSGGAAGRARQSAHGSHGGAGDRPEWQLER
jgi:hypothetical protein